MNNINITPLSPDKKVQKETYNNTGYLVSPSKDYAGTTFVAAAQLNKNTAIENDYKIIKSKTLLPIASHLIGTLSYTME